MITGAVPEAIKIEVNAWLNQRDWNFERGFYKTGIACAYIADQILRREDANRICRRVSKA